MPRVFSLICLIACIALLPLRSDNTFCAEKKKIILQQADTIEGGSDASGSFRSVIGHVVFRHGNLTLKCDSATDYGADKRVVLKGNVFFSDDSVEIYGENGVYSPDREIGELNGDVRSRVVDNSLAAKARRAVYNRRASQIALSDDVLVLHQKQQQISGDTVVIHLRGQKGRGNRQRVDEIAVKGSAFFAARDTLSLAPVVYDQFSGKSMLILLSKTSKITGITISDQAESLCHLYDEKQKPSGINYSSGDMIRMFFRGGTLIRIKVTGGVEGKQYPESFRGERSINLSTFAWREQENPFRK